jgi:hypothetical protein
MISLKAFLPVLANEFGVSEASLYERQRALVRIGLLPAPATRGRNSGGALVNPDTVSVMLIAVLATDNLSEIDERVIRLARARVEPATGKPAVCVFTKKRTFRAAVTEMLSSKFSGLSIEVSRRDTSPTARLIDEDEGIWTQFGRPETAAFERKAIFRRIESLWEALPNERSH